MPSQPIDTGWGFNAVIDLIESDFHAASPTISPATTIQPHDSALGYKSISGSIAESPLDTQNARLGDFTKLFDELGISSPDPLAPASPVDSEGLISSDDAILLEQTESAGCGDPDSPLAGLTNKQQKQARKKAAKKERKARLALEALHAPARPTRNVHPADQPRTRSNVGAKIRPATPSPLEVPLRTSKPQPPTRILNFSEIPPNSVPVVVSTQHSNSLAQPFTPRSGQFAQPTFLDSSVNGFAKPAVQQSHETKFNHGLQPQIPSSVRLSHGLVPRTVQPVSAPRVHTANSMQAYSVVPSLTAPLYKPTVLLSQAGSRADVGLTQEARYTAPTPYKLLSPNRFTTAVQLPATPGGSTKSLTVRPKTERHFHFMNQLLANFPIDSQWLLAPMPMNTEETAAQGIHCFVDASNIMIGFKDILRRSGYHQFEMSFDILALLMERRRPVAKRIYASSHREAAPQPHVTKLAKTSKAVGYENLVKEQVFIRREDSERKKFFKDVERIGWTKATQLRAGLGSGSDSETGQAAVPPTPSSAPKWVEQGVDEILHLKMCQSIIDTEVPTTMVLATGDGNAAEFSDGFLANVERALKHGWTVELVSWKQQMSAGYKNKKFRAKWGDKFKTIELDDYLESLLNTT